jgi:preprotein translocase subunit SecA
MLKGPRGLYPERRAPEQGALDRAVEGMMTRLLPAVDDFAARRLRRIAGTVASHAAAAAALSDAALRAALAAIHTPMRQKGMERGPTTQALALLAEACRRATGLRPHPVQLMGAMALVEGRLAEMQTGEGKTIVAALVGGVAGLAGLPTHVVTVNDYLADRDAALARAILATAGISVGVIRHGDAPEQRRAQYRCDVTYVSNKELAFDYLRDQDASGCRGRCAGAPLLRGLHFAIVDEADSILIDDARTPLILAGEASSSPEEADVCRSALAAAATLIERVHYVLAPDRREVALTAAGSAAIGHLLSGGGLWRARQAREEMVRHALAARRLFKRDRDYIVIDGAVCIVDESTGRIAEGRSWQNGLHQMIEAVEGLPPSAQSVTRASITFQDFFSRYLRLSGLSGTLAEVAAECRVVYGRSTVRIPTRLPARRRHLGTSLLAGLEAKWNSVAVAAAAQVATGRPVLIGTRSIAASELVSRQLHRAGLAHVVLNARHDSDEAAIVAAAGQAGRITVATNMAGRGTDIRLDAAALRAGGLHVILTELHESRRIDRQLIGRGARQGDPGSFELVLSLEDELFVTYAPGALRFGVAWLRWRAQAAAERKHRGDRQRVMQSHRRLKEVLSFAGAG